VDGIEFDLIDDYQRLPKVDLHSNGVVRTTGKKIDQTLAGFSEWNTKGISPRPGLRVPFRS